MGVQVSYRLTNSDVPYSDTMDVWILQADGTKLESGINNLKSVFGWDGIDPWWLMWEDPAEQTTPRSFADVEFKLAECNHEEYTNEAGKTSVSFKPSFLNALDGGKNYPLADRDEFMKKFGAKFRAGGTPVKTPAKTKLPTRKPPTAKSEPCTGLEAFAAAKAKHPDLAEDALANEVFYPAIEKLFPGLTEDQQNKLSKEQYGQLKAHFV